MEYVGGEFQVRRITRSKLISVTNTTSVCVSSGVVTQVEMPEAFQQVYSAALGWRKSGVEKSSLGVGWEGRGVARGDFSWGAGGWDFLYTTVCSQLRLNANMRNYAASDHCSLNG